MQNDIDILLATHQHDLTGGAEISLLETIAFLKSNGLSLLVLVGAEGEFSQALENMGVPYHIVFLPFWAHGTEDPSPFITSSLNPTVNTLLQIVGLINDKKPSLCISNTIVMPWLAYASSITKTPHAWMIHELSSGGLGLRYALGEGQTVRSIGELSDIVLFNSQYTQGHYQQMLPDGIQTGIIYPGAKEYKPEIIEDPFNGTPANRTLRLTVVSQVKPQKGQMDVAKAMIELQKRGVESQSLFVGIIEDEPYKNEILKLLKEHSLEDRVKFTGFQNNPASYLFHSDIAIVSATGEAFGRVTVEGMLSGKPVIAAASAATTEIINDGKDGLLYTPGDATHLADKIEYLVSNKHIARRLGKQGATSAKKKFIDPDTRYAPLMNYFRSLPQPKNSLDLSMLSGVISDFQRTVSLLEASKERLRAAEARLESIRSFLPIRVYSKIRSYFVKH